MKPYFVRYLPVEGEIKDGDLIMNARGEVFPCRWEPCELTTKKVKLFLCSRDIQIGDIVQHDVGESKCETEEQRQFYLSRGSYKVIGEISPDALYYVKEGNEFDEDQIQYGSEGDKWSDAIYIKGPCGHFH